MKEKKMVRDLELLDVPPYLFKGNLHPRLVVMYSY